MEKNQIVAIGVLTQGDIDRLGSGFDRMFPVSDTGDFQDLLDAIDRTDVARCDVVESVDRFR